MPDYHKVKTYLSEQKYHFNTRRPDSEKTFRVVIRGLVNDTDELKDELNNKGLTVTQVLQLRKTGTKTAIPLFLVELPDSKPNKQIYSFSKILSQRISVEPEHRRRPPICTRCLDYSHTNKYCERKPRCGACSGAHQMLNCKQPSTDPPKCANCGGPHKGIWKGCPNYQRFLTRNTPPTEPHLPNNPSQPRPQPAPLPQRNAWTDRNSAPQTTRTDKHPP